MTKIEYDDALLQLVALDYAYLVSLPEELEDFLLQGWPGYLNLGYEDIAQMCAVYFYDENGGKVELFKNNKLVSKCDINRTPVSDKKKWLRRVK